MLRSADETFGARRRSRSVSRGLQSFIKKVVNIGVFYIRKGPYIVQIWTVMLIFYSGALVLAQLQDLEILVWAHILRSAGSGL